jgi:hypothetical protein
VLINVWQIVKDNYNLNKKDSDGIHVEIWFYLVPIIIAIFATFLLNINYIGNVTTIVISFVSITTGFLINIAILINSGIVKTDYISERLRKRLNANTNYAILVGFLLVVFIIIKAFHILSYSNPITNNLNVLQQVVPFFSGVFVLLPIIYGTIITFFLLHYLFCLLVIIKGFYSHIE